ncbi:DUF982 domain-containing protein [Mesorhizobium sp.]|uniref:DUF982 domain-containing protein n=1 Tax=Mesorhizobium sp. TaxID=1871066 RepID=UPI003457F466
MCVGREIDHRRSQRVMIQTNKLEPRHSVVEPVERDDIARHRALATLLVLSVSDAAEVLLRDWPTPTSKTRLSAIEACLAVIRGEKPPRVAPSIHRRDQGREDPARRTNLDRCRQAEPRPGNSISSLTCSCRSPRARFSSPDAELELLRQSLDPNRHNVGRCACRAEG